ncbi:lipolytic enzyme, g-d-s-l [Heliomicrobium modesticaldum Ice1]|uniref:Lipolytic enzyme, g-d-s-l n=1 Tax=Heliobacterium modesticaldum (strain ATCC 51547 / Ice1) TaxID=498761 RepID=B0TE03_HELMI|nr:GDSL-type esterase/lipase family protein [Heliomicrobium modesticaldum]ABZ84198.1 lipolytic enzyme, g-d-s-l [Heliomicrobium modesticaldum Ice1]
MYKNREIFAVGDSLTWGYPYGPDDSWTAMVERELAYPVINLGLNGATTDDMRRELINILPDVEPRSVVIITGGANDAYNLVSPAKSLRHYQDMVERILIARCLPVIGLTGPINDEPFQTRLLEFRALMRDHLGEMLAPVTRQWGAQLSGHGPVIDFFSALVAADGRSLLPDLASGDCHPNRAGYAKMGETAVAALRQIVK